MGSKIVARNVRKTFQTGRGARQLRTKALRGISLKVNAGEMVSIVGPSGSGKSTLLHCLSGLETADEGSIELEGTQVVGASHAALTKLRRMHVGFVFQSYNLIPSLSAGDNVALPARLAGRPLPARCVESALKSVGLAERAKHRPHDLSGGEQQRVALARAFASETSVVFADEPTGALDTQNGQMVLGLLRDIADDPRRAVVMVTHDLEAASRADRVFVLRDGCVVRELGRSSAAQILAAMKEQQ